MKRVRTDSWLAMVNGAGALALDRSSNVEMRRIATLFRSAFLEEALESPVGALDSRGVRGALNISATLAEVLEDAYDWLRLHYRNEYVYKNELLAYIGARAKYASSVPITELNVSWFDGRVDSVIVGQSTYAFEVKTRLDSLARVKKQTDLNLKIFGFVSVVCEASSIARVLAQIDPRVGLVELKAEGGVRFIRRPADNRNLVENDVVFRCLRKDEYRAAVQKRFGRIPKTTNLQQERYCRDIFQSLTARECHDVLRDALAERYSLNRDLWIKDIPPALRQLWCATKPTQRGRLFEESLLLKML